MGWLNYRKLSQSHQQKQVHGASSAISKGIMDVFNDPKIEQVVFAKSAQVGATENTAKHNWLLHRSRPCSYVNHAANITNGSSIFQR